MKDFKVVPYPEVSKTLDEATRKTLQAYYEAKAVSGQNNTPKKAAAGQNKTLKKSKA
ncbi:MAG: hypothetical protein FWE78_01405 [Methanimicrococcus sp.]|nr:hypothetical protein [Methanimicrococcus sp.]